MEKTQVHKTLKALLEVAPKRNFTQSIDLIVNLKDIDLKKQDNKVDIFVQLHHDRGKAAKICGLVGPELRDEAKKHFETAILVDDFAKHDKKVVRRLAGSHAWFVAQATVMPKVAQTFGRVLGPRGKMPNPKAGCVVPPGANLEAVSRKLHRTVRVKIDANPLFQAMVGRQDSPHEEVVDNVLTVYKALVHALPQEENNVRSAFLKLTMGPVFRIGETEPAHKREDVGGRKKGATKKGAPVADKEDAKNSAKEASSAPQSDESAPEEKAEPSPKKKTAKKKAAKKEAKKEEAPVEGDQAKPVEDDAQTGDEQQAKEEGAA